MKAQNKTVETKPQPVIFLQGKRVRLRPLDILDVDRCTAWINDEEIRSFLGSTLPTTRIQEEEWIKTKQSKDEVVLAIETCEGLHIGNMSIFRINWIDRTATTGAMIGDKNIGTMDMVQKPKCYCSNTHSIHLVYAKFIRLHTHTMNVA